MAGRLMVIGTALDIGHTSRLPTGDTADCQSALLGVRLYLG